MIPPKGGNEGPHGDDSQRDADARESGAGREVLSASGRYAIPAREERG